MLVQRLRGVRIRDYPPLTWAQSEQRGVEMRCRFASYLGILFLLVNVCVKAQTYEDRERIERLKREAAEAEMQRIELVTLQKEAGRAMQLRNSSYFNRVYSDDYFGTTASGNVQDKAALIASIQNSTMNYTSFVVTEIRIRIYQNTAVVTCLWSSRGTVNGAAFSRQSRVMSAYVNNGQGWKVVVSQETALPG
jgi:hypothetical protein